jgi:hypothetical protein
MPRPTIVFTAVFVAGLIVLLAFAVFEKRDEAFTLGVSPALPIHANAGQTLCQTPIDVSAEFDRAQLTLADGTVAAGRVRDARTQAAVGAPVAEGRRVEVCITGPAEVLGNAAPASRSSHAVRDGKPLESDLSIVFVRNESTSLLALSGDILERASLFHGSWVKPWLMGVLGLLLLTAFPLLLGAALRESSR